MPRVLLSLILLGLFAAACREAPRHPRIELNPALGSIDVHGLPASTLARVGARAADDPAWSSLLRVSVRRLDTAEPVPPVSGRYQVVDGLLRFLPIYPLDPGRDYDVRLDLAAPEGLPPLDVPPITATVRPAAAAPSAPTVVAAVYPSGDHLPANQLRLYVHFSQAMDRRSGAGLVALFDERGDEVVDAFLPLDADLWNREQTRYTVFFDPGRVKRGILPNREMGRALVPGRHYTLVVRRGWRDRHGEPLAEEFRRTFTAGPAVESPLAMSDWTFDAPAAGSREPLTVRFPAPLDHGLLQRSLVVRQAGVEVAGQATTGPDEMTWQFAPDAAWAADGYELVALAVLEDLAGNRIGRAFEAEAGLDGDSAPASGVPATRPFTITP